MIHLEADIHESTIILCPELSNIGRCRIKKGGKIHSHVWIGDGVDIGEDCKIQAFSFIPTGVKLGNRVFLGPRVTFTNDKNPPSDRKDWQFTLVMDDVIIGAGAVILPGIVLNKGARIGAGAVVTKNVPSNETWFGNPARQIGG